MHAEELKKQLTEAKAKDHDAYALPAFNVVDPRCLVFQLMCTQCTGKFAGAMICEKYVLEKGKIVTEAFVQPIGNDDITKCKKDVKKKSPILTL